MLKDIGLALSAILIIILIGVIAFLLIAWCPNETIRLKGGKTIRLNKILDEKDFISLNVLGLKKSCTLREFITDEKEDRKK